MVKDKDAKGSPKRMISYVKDIKGIEEKTHLKNKAS
jgi:hypothetical protein